MRNLLAVTLVAGLFLGLSSTATADWKDCRKDGYHCHDGFFLRLSTGVGQSNAKTGSGKSEIEVSGLSGITSLGVGGALARNLIVNVDIFGAQANQDPDVKIGGTDAGLKDVSATYAAIGPGLTYYVMPFNAYVAAAVGMAMFEIKSDADKAKSDGGYGFNVMLGKEWWVSDNWGLGVAGQYMYMNIDEKDSKSTWDMWAAGVLFSATYN